MAVESALPGVWTPGLVGLLALVIALAFRVSANRAVRLGILVAIGFQAVFIIVELFAGVVGETAAAVAASGPLALSAVDAGWPTAALIAFGTVRIGLWVIPLFIVTNVALFAVGFTHTLDVDIFNYWHMAFIATLAYTTTGNWAYAVLLGLLLGVFALVIADWTQPAVEEHFELEDIAIPHGFTAVLAAIAVVLHVILRRTPIGNGSLKGGTVQERFEALGEPIYLGIVIGGVLGVVRYSNSLDTVVGWSRVLMVAVTFATVMHVLPMVASILVEGINPLQEAVRDLMTGWFDREFAVGLDAAVLVGRPSIAAAGLLMVPIALVEMLVLPGNRLLWGVDLATFPFFFALMAPIVDDDVVEMVVIGAIVLVPMHYIATWLAPALTETARDVGIGVPEGATITTGTVGSPANGLLLLTPEAAIAIAVAVIVAVFLALRRWPKRMYMLAGASEEKADGFIARRHAGESPGWLPNRL